MEDRSWREEKIQPVFHTIVVGIDTYLAAAGKLSLIGVRVETRNRWTSKHRLEMSKTETACRHAESEIEEGAANKTRKRAVGTRGR